MAEAPGVNVEQLFTPEADLSAYESVTERDLYLTFVKSVFNHQGKSTDDHNIMPPFVGTYVAALSNAATKTDEKIQVLGNESRAMRVQTSAIEEQWAGLNYPWGPDAAITLSTIDDEKLVRFTAGTVQNHQEFFIGARATFLDPLTGKPESKTALVQSTWAGNTGNIGASEANARRVFQPQLFREMTATEKRVIGVALEGLGQLAVVSA